LKIAILSDLHGNAVAFDATLEDVRSAAPDAIVCLGDVAQGGPQPAEVIARLRDLACPVVLGNADAYLADGADSGAETMDDERRRRLDAVRAWSLTKLGARDLDFLRGFRPTVELPLEDDRRLLGYHGSPRSYDDVIVATTPEEQVRAWLEPEERTVYTGGHTHVQFVRHLGRTFHFNPGSIGHAYRHDQPEAGFRLDPWAEYALLSTDRGRVSLEFRRVPFDVARLIDVYGTSGRPFAEEVVRQYGS
jgi:predicted phosphodiesterase